MQPVLVPKSVQQLCVVPSLEERVLNFVILVSVKSKLLELFFWHGGAAVDILGLLQLFSVLVRVGTENSNFDLTGRHGSFRVDDDGKSWVFDHLLALLSLHIDSGKPASVSRVRMVPSTDVLGPANGLTDS